MNIARSTWTTAYTASSGAIYSSGFNARASFGQQLAPHFAVRYDAFTNQFDGKTAITAPCPPNGCSGSVYDVQSKGMIGLTANGLVSVDSRRIFYMIAGAGLYDVHGQTTELHFGVSGGAGIAVPIAESLRAVVEARWHGLLGPTSGPSSLVPITIGFRF
jgi:hypothetical protein